RASEAGWGRGPLCARADAPWVSGTQNCRGDCRRPPAARVDRHRTHPTDLSTRALELTGRGAPTISSSQCRSGAGRFDYGLRTSPLETTRKNSIQCRREVDSSDDRVPFTSHYRARRNGGVAGRYVRELMPARLQMEPPKSGADRFGRISANRAAGGILWL